jgi:hypothetical protein
MQTEHNVQLYAGILAMLAVPCLRADLVVAQTANLGPAPAMTLARHAVAVGPAGFFSRTASALDSNAAKVLITNAPPDGGPYPNPIVVGGSSTLPIANPGKRFDPTATGCLTYGPGFWDSTCSSAVIVPLADGTQPETAKATAIATDPANYSVVFDPNFTAEIDFSVTLGAGLLAANGAGDTSSSASESGFDATNLLADPLWSWSWSADSAHPNSSVFKFQSNPLLKLDDAAIMAAFMSGVTDSSGVHTMALPLTITGSLFPDVAPGAAFDYTFGGERVYEADATAAPEPSPVVLFGAGLLAVAVGSLRRRGRS